MAAPGEALRSWRTAWARTPRPVPVRRPATTPSARGERQAGRGRPGRRRRRASAAPPRSGRQPGREEDRSACRQTARAKGFWRSKPIVTSTEVSARPDGLRPPARPASVPDLERRLPSAPRPSPNSPRRHVSASHRDQARLLSRALPLRSRHMWNARRRPALG